MFTSQCTIYMDYSNYDFSMDDLSTIFINCMTIDDYPSKLVILHLLSHQTLFRFKHNCHVIHK